MLFETHSEIDLHEQSPLNLAFVGDGVYELLVRQRLVERTRLQPGALHAAAVRYVSAKGQFRALELLAFVAGRPNPPKKCAIFGQARCIFPRTGGNNKAVGGSKLL